MKLKPLVGSVGKDLKDKLNKCNMPADSKSWIKISSLHFFTPFMYDRILYYCEDLGWAQHKTACSSACPATGDFYNCTLNRKHEV